MNGDPEIQSSRRLRATLKREKVALFRGTGKGVSVVPFAAVNMTNGTILMMALQRRAACCR